MNKRNRIKTKVSDLLRKIEEKSKDKDIHITVGSSVWNYLEGQKFLKKDDDKTIFDFSKINQDSGNFSSHKKR